MARTQRIGGADGRSKGKCSEKLPSKQERRHASRSLNYNECAHPGGIVTDSDYDADGDRHGDSDDDDGGDVQPINGFYNNSYVSSSEDVRELCSPKPNKKRIQHTEADYKSTTLDGVDAIAAFHDVDAITNDDKHREGEDFFSDEEQNFHRDLHDNLHSSPKTKEEQSVDELIEEVLAELAEEEKCEADKRIVPSNEPATPSKMESEGLLLRKHELENYAMRARDR